jgi:probable HAF family extracellular repeat protein
MSENNGKEVQMTFQRAIIIFPILIAMLTIGCSDLPEYEITDLGNFGSDPYQGHFDVSKINNKGQVLATTDGQVILVTNSNVVVLSTGCQAYAMNDKGQVVGNCQTVDRIWHGFLYSEGVIKVLDGNAYDINNAGQVVGESDNHAFIYSNGKLQDFRNISKDFKSSNPQLEDPQSCAYGISNNGQVVGEIGNHAFLFDNGKVLDLGSLSSSGWSKAKGINDLGQVVGTSSACDGSTNHAFLYSNGKMMDLGHLGGNSEAFSINNKGQVVGQSGMSWYRVLWKRWRYEKGVTEYLTAFLYSDGRMIDLGSLLPFHSGWTLYEANSINDHGQIIGIGSYKGTQHAFLMTPVRQGQQKR